MGKETSSSNKHLFNKPITWWRNMGAEWVLTRRGNLPLGAWRKALWKRWHLIGCLKLMRLRSKSTRKVPNEERTAMKNGPQKRVNWSWGFPEYNARERNSVCGLPECTAGEMDRSLGFPECTAGEMALNLGLLGQHQLQPQRGGAITRSCPHVKVCICALAPPTSGIWRGRKAIRTSSYINQKFPKQKPRCRRLIHCTKWKGSRELKPCGCFAWARNCALDHISSPTGWEWTLLTPSCK